MSQREPNYVYVYTPLRLVVVFLFGYQHNFAPNFFYRHDLHICYLLFPKYSMCELLDTLDFPSFICLIKRRLIMKEGKEMLLCFPVRKEIEVSSK